MAKYMIVLSSIFLSFLILTTQIAADGNHHQGPSHDNFMCSMNQDCISRFGPSSFCETPIGKCDKGSGQCSAVTEACTREYNPVCGCDGVTYDNPCMARAQRVSLAAQGPCGDASVTNCGSNQDCRRNEYCHFVDGTCNIKHGINPKPGKCEPRPRQCSDERNIVCGCDKRTYLNPCIAATHGESVLSSGFCMSSSVSCRKARDCKSWEFCSRSSCNEVGTCERRPQVCPAIFAPVCGCNNVTYSSECNAQSAGQSVAFAGECPPRPCESNKDCRRSEFCEKTDCLAETGSCAPRPKKCDFNRDIICGCDGRSFLNECIAQTYGVNTAYAGRCNRTVCTGNNDCGKFQFCKKSDCNATTSGLCEQRPRFCTPSTNLVCGCDGRTYLNPCIADSWGVNIRSNGTCSAICRENQDCQSGFYCSKTTCTAQTGTCTRRPEACTMQYDPVCGCNNVTYGNACSAASAGVNIMSQGECLVQTPFSIVEEEED